MMPSFSKDFGQDLRLAGVQRWVLDKLRELKPKLVILVFPCTHWSTIMNMMKDREKLGRWRTEDEVFLNFVEEVVLVQKEHGGHWIIENPRSSAAWGRKALQRVAEYSVEAVADQCMYNLRAANGLRHKKATKFLCSHPALAKELPRPHAVLLRETYHGEGRHLPQAACAGNGQRT